MLENPFLQLLLVIGIGLLFYAILRKVPRLFWFFFVLLPLGLTSFWFQKGAIDLFFWVKVYLVLLFTSFMSWMRCYPKALRKVHYFFLYFLLLLNIILPTWIMFSLDTLAGSLNAISGLLLIATFPAMKSLQIDQERSHDLLWDAPYFWIFGYTLWNWLFIALAYPHSILTETGVISIPLLVSFFNRKVWLQVRAYTLAFFLIFGLTFYDWIKSAFNQPELNESVKLILCIASVFWMTLFFVYMHASKVKKLWMK